MQIKPLTEDVTSLPDAGLGALRTARGNLPLESVDIHATVTGLCAGVTMTQSFANPFDVPLEATYVFPLPDRAAVTAMRMEAAGHVVQGVLKERGQARADYDAALAAGRRAAMAEEERPDVFTMSVGNIPPGERVTVRLTLSQPLPYEDGAATLRFPLVVAPRYIPGTPLDGRAAGAGVAPDTDMVPDASRISTPVLLPGFPNPVRLAVSVDLDPAGLELSEIRSSLHTVTDGSTVRLRPGERLDRDFILRLRYATGTSGVVSDGTFTLTVVPSGEAAHRPRDVVLVLDRSGSMTGWKMVAARRAAARIVDTLDGTDRFAVLSFDHEMERALPGGLVAATDRNRYRAVEHLARLDARGGTEMLRPLLDAVALLSEDVADRDRVLVLVTDGQVGNEDQILARLSLDGIRLHAVGIDRAVNAGFLGRLAAAGAGRCELVESEDRLDEVMDHVHRRIAAPLVTNLSLDLPAAEPDTIAPSRLGDLFPGVPLVVRGRCTGSGPVTVRGIAADGSPWTRRIELVERTDPSATAIWARGHLRDLEDRYAASADPALEQRITDTSLRHGVLCRFTAFVAVDSRVATDGTPSHHVIQPVEMPSGWDLADGAVAASGVMPIAPQAAPPRPRSAQARTHAVPPSPVSVPPPAGPPPAPAPPTAPPALTTGGTPSGQGAPSGPAWGFGVARRRPRLARETILPVVDARAHVARELRRLRAARPASEQERRQFLADLGSRLAVLLPGKLTDLVAALRACDDPAGPRGEALDELWERTLRELAAYTEGVSAGPEQAFWRRRPR